MLFSNLSFLASARPAVTVAGAFCRFLFLLLSDEALSSCLAEKRLIAESVAVSAELLGSAGFCTVVDVFERPWREFVASDDSAFFSVVVFAAVSTSCSDSDTASGVAVCISESVEEAKESPR